MNQKSRIVSVALVGVLFFLLLSEFSQAGIPYEVDARGGRVLRIPGFDLRRAGAEFGRSGNPAREASAGVSEPFRYEAGVDGIGYYRLNRSNTSAKTISLLPNRSYIISVLLNADFERNRPNRTAEINLGLRTYDGGGKNVIDNLNGLPSRTNGWQRWEWEFTTDQRVSSGRVHINFYGFPEGGKVLIGDITLVELAAKPLRPYMRGQGVTFRGGPGNLPMKVEYTRATEDKIEVRTTGALYTFDLSRDEITARQMLEKERDVSVWGSSVSLSGLEILATTERECVLGNDGMTIGVQCDSLMMIAPHDEVEFSCTSRIGGKWNRLACGHLFVVDEYGGFAVNPDIPLGCGHMARVDSGVRPGRVVAGQLDFSGKVDDQTFVSKARPGWRIKWYISPGERLAISTFPPRPYPWKQSLESTYLISRSNVPLEKYEQWSRHATDVIMWNFVRRGWGGSQGTKFLVYDDAVFRRHITAMKKAGMRPCPYISPYFYCNRDPAEFAAEAKRLKDTYDIEGAYYDGIPSQEWIATYEVMRMTREVFKDGTIIYHNTGHASNGTAPLGEPSMKIPAVETYADFTYAGELVYGYGPDWPYPKYVASQYRLANCIGTMKASKWDGVTPEQRDLIMLGHNGRSCMLPQGHEGTPSDERMEQLEAYWPILEQLRKLWQQKGGEPNFYENYYLPRYKELTRGMVPHRNVDY